MSPALVGLLLISVAFAGSAFMFDMMVAKRPNVDRQQIKFIRMAVLISDILILAVLWFTGIAQTVGEMIVGAAG